MPHYPKEEQFYERAEAAKHDPVARFMFITYDLNGEEESPEQLFDFPKWEALGDKSITPDDP